MDFLLGTCGSSNTNFNVHTVQELEQKLFKLLVPDAISVKPQLPVDETSFLNPDIVKEVKAGGFVNRLKVCAYGEKSQHMKSVEHILEQITNVLALESVVTHHELGYTGTFDCVAKYRYEPCRALHGDLSPSSGSTSTVIGVNCV